MRVALWWFGSRYAEIFERPLARRDERTARPPFVAIRARKPCFLARLRLFGWNVRLVVISNPFLLLGLLGWCRPAGSQLIHGLEGVTVGEIVDKGQTQPPLDDLTGNDCG